ncbi:hypothetical protein [Duganella violaceipulchra]|uniref:Plasmid stabilization protein n=1 Tax=Duganella violaceipulchra TaxID=2849652 RepID=A0AA41H9E5_9BURK|nr:hypothetical protein [Duganella violaceicalia]MBV6321995.1 hypothetical protein [Duganella violaceicalia]MCP2007008.1 hypothetical protein [Duganella violaceicalia]
MPKGASPKREREYKELEHKFEKEGRYPGREEEVAARIVNKQRAEAGETEDSKPKESGGAKPRSGTGHRRANTTRAARRSKPS